MVLLETRFCENNVRVTIIYRNGHAFRGGFGQAEGTFDCITIMVHANTYYYTDFVFYIKCFSISLMVIKRRFAAKKVGDYKCCEKKKKMFLQYLLEGRRNNDGALKS